MPWLHSVLSGVILAFRKLVPQLCGDQRKVQIFSDHQCCSDHSGLSACGGHAEIPEGSSI